MRNRATQYQQFRWLLQELCGAADAAAKAACLSAVTACVGHSGARGTAKSALGRTAATVHSASLAAAQWAGRRAVPRAGTAAWKAGGGKAAAHVAAAAASTPAACGFEA